LFCASALASANFAEKYRSQGQTLGIANRADDVKTKQAKQNNYEDVKRQKNVQNHLNVKL